jgi:hypothetical protein
LTQALDAEKVPTEFSVTLKKGYDPQMSEGLQKLISLNMVIGKAADNFVKVGDNIIMRYVFDHDCRAIINAVSEVNFDFVESIQY